MIEQYAALAMVDEDWSWWLIPTTCGSTLYGYRVRAGAVLSLYITSEDDAALVRSPAPEGTGYSRGSLAAQIEAIRLDEP